MPHREYLSLPNNFRRSYLHEGKERDLSDWSPLVIRNEEEFSIETDAGKVKPKSSHQVFNLLLQHHNLWYSCPPEKVDSIVSFLSDVELYALARLGKVKLDGYTIVRLSGHYTITNDWGDRTDIYNISPFYKIKILETADGIRKAVQDLLLSRETFNIPTISFISPSAESRSLALSFDEIRHEILISKKLSLGDLDLFNSACYGGRMETCGIGTENQVHIDMVKAHLNILKDYPGLEGVKIARGYHHYDAALDHSIYRIVVDIKDRSKFNPLPTRDNENRVIYRTGRVIGWYFKDYLLMLERSNIPFKILDSYQFFGEPTYPFRQAMKFIHGMSNASATLFPELETKHFYCTLVGSTKHIRRTYNKQLNEVQIAGGMFDPLVFGFVLARQNTQVYLRAVEQDAEAIKIDSYSTIFKPNMNIPEGFKIKGSGSSLFITPYLKSTPDNPRDQYRQRILENPNSEYILLQYYTWRGLDSFINEGVMDNCGLGKEHRAYVTIRPSYGNRTGTKIRRVVNLLDCWFLSSPSNAPVDTGQMLFSRFLERRLNHD